MRKEITTLAWDVDEETYRADRAISYSTLSRYKKEGFKGLPHLFDKIESPSLLFGSLVDTILTSPEEFNDIFLIAEMPKISDSLEEIARYLAGAFGAFSSLDDIDDEILADIGEHFDYYKNDKYKAYRVKNIRKECERMFQILKNSKGKKVVTQELLQEARETAQAVINTPETARFFSKTKDDTKVQIHHQIKLRGNYEGIPVRCMFDGLIVDHENKIIIPFDLKTSSKAEYEFPFSFVQWNYEYQAKLYSYILSKAIEEDEYFKNFKIGPYQFVVVSRFTKSPMRWKYENNLNQDYIKDKEGNPTLQPWEELLRELHTYLSMDELPRKPLWASQNNLIPGSITKFKK